MPLMYCLSAFVHLRRSVGTVLLSCDNLFYIQGIIEQQLALGITLLWATGQRFYDRWLTLVQSYRIEVCIIANVALLRQLHRAPPAEGKIMNYGASFFGFSGLAHVHSS